MIGSYLPTLIEIALAVVIVSVTIAIGVRRLDQTFAGIARRTMRVLILAVFIRPLYPLTEHVVDGILPRSIVALFTAGAISIALMWLVPASWRDSCRRSIAVFVERRSRWLRFGVKTLVLIVFWAVMLVTVDLTATFIAGSTMGTVCQRRTLVLCHWIAEENENTPQDPSQRDQSTSETNDRVAKLNGQPGNPATTIDSSNGGTDAISAAADRQADFFGRFTSGLQRSRTALYAKIGIDDLKNEVQLVQRLHQLDIEDKLWLIKHNKDLAALAADPAFTRIIENKPLLRRIDRFTSGSLDQLVHIGMDKDINCLLQDEDLLRRIRKINMRDLLRQCEQRPRQADGIIDSD